MLKRFWTLTVIIAILALPVMAGAVNHKMVVGSAVIADDAKTVTVPLQLSNGNHLVGIDVALKYSEGVTIKEVRFENSRIGYFDLKATMLDPEKRTVVIMAVPQLTMTKKPALAEGDGEFAQLVFEINNPTVNSILLEPTVMEDPHHSLFMVYAKSENGEYTQWREDPTFENGRVALSSSTASSVPRTFGLNQNWPNPFNPSTDISFDVPVNTHVQLNIFNVLGQQVRSLVDRDMPAGTHTVVWDGRNDDGGSVSSGVYFYRIQARDFTATKKMMMLK